jgi:hypothetical protein
MRTGIFVDLFSSSYQISADASERPRQCPSKIYPTHYQSAIVPQLDAIQSGDGPYYYEVNMALKEYNN